MEKIAEPMDVDTSFHEDDYMAKDFDQKSDGLTVSHAEPITLSRLHPNRTEAFTTGIDIFCEEERSKMEVRAKRFGLSDKLKTALREEDLYSSMGVTEENGNAKNLRLNVLHMRGTADMSTKDVFKYFEDYAPVSIEWINDISCNVVWHDNISAARALLRLSKRIVGLGEKVAADGNLKSEASNFVDENKQVNDNRIDEIVGDEESTGGEGINKIDDENVISLTDVNCPLPPGFWRKGIDHPNSKAIFLRFATRTDKKQPRAEKMSDYYKKYGNPNFGGIKGLLTESRKRMYMEAHQTAKRDQEENQTRDSDDEGKRKRSKNPWGLLSKTWGQNDAVEDDFVRSESVSREQVMSVKERLGVKSRSKGVSYLPTTVKESDSESSSENSDEEWCKRSKVLRMRMHADDEEEKVLKKRILQRTQGIYGNVRSQSNDLRSRLENPKKEVYCEAIQVVVTNDPENYRMQRPHIHQSQVPEVTEAEEEPEEGEWTPEAEQFEDLTGIDDKEDEDSENSDVSEKEIQGPKGSVIKVVPRMKPRVASTVWARLNNTNLGQTSEANERSPYKGNLTGRLKTDVRSRLGYHNRGRSPLRIEVKNDKYGEECSGTE